MARPAGSRSNTGGNFTRGANRKGNKNGRKPLHPPGTPLAYINVRLPMDLHSVCRVIGVGNVSKGVRTAIEWSALVMPLWAQNETKVDELLKLRVYGAEQARAIVREAFGRFQRALSGHWDDTARAEPLPPSSVPSSLCDMDDDDEADDKYVPPEDTDE